MTRGPRRLKDDPDFKWETGCDISDEGRVVGNYDLETSRSRLLAAVALLPAVTVGDGIPTVRPGTSAWRAAARPVVGAVTGAMVIAAAYWLGVQSGTERPAATSPVEMSVPSSPVENAPVIVPTTEGVATPPEIPSGSPVVVPEVVVRHSPFTKVVPTPVVETSPEGLADAQPEVAIVEPPVASDGIGALGTADAGSAPRVGAAKVAPTSQIGIEMAVLEPAIEALGDDRFDAARKGYQDYLARFPNGKMVVEAQWGLLMATYGSGDTAGTEAVARTMQDLPEFSSRREDILRLRAESLVHLDRCDDALLVAEELASRSAAEIRRVCRQPRRELP